MYYEVDESVNLRLVCGGKVVVHLADVQTHDPDRQRYPPGLVGFSDHLVSDEGHVTVSEANNVQI